MFKYILGLSIAVVLMGFKGDEIHVSEDGIIPDGSVLAAYLYRDGCINRESEPDAMRARVIYKSATGQGMSIEALCQEEMFVLFGKLNYKVISTDFIGRSKIVHEDTTIEGVNAFLRI